MISVRYKPKSVTNRTGIVMIIPVLKYVPHEIFTPFVLRHVAHNVAKDQLAF